jgi:polyhydroxybutyrate depolymerase
VRILRFCLYALLAIVASVVALFGYFVYTPAPEKPHLSGTLTRGALDVDGTTRTYLTYVPGGTAKGVPVVLVMHGSGESGARIRAETGYGFDRLADEHHFVVVYPDAAGNGDWNACGTVGDDRSNARSVDDVRFLTGVVRKLAIEIGVDPNRAFAAGSSRGGFMAFRLALEAPSAFRAVAAVSANVHTPDNFKCKPAADRTSSIMIMNGTKDPLVPFDGGEVSFLGFSYKYGRVMSSQESARYFADLNHIAGPPATNETQVADGVRVKDMTWHNESNTEVELVAIDGGGHGIPQPYRRHARVLGPSPREPNGPAVIWAFFDRQRR